METESHLLRHELCHQLFKEKQMSEEEKEVVAYDDEFDLDKDYKPVPLIPQGEYNGNIVEARMDDGIGAVVIVGQLQGNPEMMCSDAETPVDGQSVALKIWLPKPGDESAMTPKGNQTKRQWKLNNLKECMDKLGINAPTLSAMREQMAEGKWNLDNVTISVEVSTYKGQVSNDARSITV